MKTINILLAIGLLIIGQTAAADGVKLPDGMGGVPDIGAIPCAVFTEMMVIGPKGTRLSLLTWANGYLYATHGKTLDELATDAEAAGERWDFDRLTDHFVEYCADNPQAMTRDAVINLDKSF